MRAEGDTERIRKAAWKEYRAFKKLMLRKPKNSIWKDSGKIHFYSAVMEYFRYCPDVEKRHWKILDGLALPIRSMWNCYLKYEYLEYSTWREMEEILMRLESDYILAGVRRAEACR